MKEKESIKQEVHACIKAISANPKDPALYRNLGALQVQCKDYMGASKSFRSARELELRMNDKKDSPDATLPSLHSSEAYLKLLKDCLTYQLWDASDGNAFEVRWSKPFISLARIIHKIKAYFNPQKNEVREFGMDWPAKALTMAGMERLNNVEDCVKQLLEDNIPGDLIETGVWRGGCAILMKATLKSLGDQKRTIWLADSFEGMPKPNKKLYPADKRYDLSMWQTLAVSVEEVKENFKRFDLLDDRVKFLKGWFSETLPNAPVEKLAMIRLDGDLYESTLDSLTHLYHKLSDGGFLIVDDYHCAPPCKKAVDDFREQYQIKDTIVSIDWSGIYWRKNLES